MTNRTLKRVNPKSIDATLKEAVSEGLLFELYHRVSGEGYRGNVLLGDRPSSYFISGFLQPAYIPRLINPRTIDSTNNPIHVITTGIDFQAKKGNTSEVEAAIDCSVYLRVLPTKEDLEKKHTYIELSADSENVLREELSGAKDRFDRDFQGLKDRNKAEYYRKRESYLADVREKTLRDTLGIVLGNSVVEEFDQSRSEERQIEESFGDDALESFFEGESTTDSTGDQEDNEVGENVAFEAFPGMASTIPASTVKQIKPLQKWIKLPLPGLPLLGFNLNGSLEEIEAACDQATIKLNTYIQNEIVKWLGDNNPDYGGKLWAFPKRLRITPDNIKHWDAFLDNLRKNLHSTGDPNNFSIPIFNLEWKVERSDIPGDKNRFSIRIAIENQSAAPPRNISTEVDHAIFQVSLSVKMKKDDHARLSLDRVKPSYRYNKYLKYPALGFNNGVISETNNDTVSFKTTWIPTYVQPRVTQAKYDGVEVSFRALQTKEGLDSLSSLSGYYLRWIDEVENNTDPGFGADSDEEVIAEKAEFARDLKKWRCEATQIEKGIKLLQESCLNYEQNPHAPKAFVFGAWRLLNETMELSSKKKGYSEWRLFQVAFILAHISGFASKLDEYSHLYDAEWDESVALLYFATGGGKSEAFFGLLIFNLFFDRLRGKLFGVTALIRYPLRLLTIQQAQRLAKTLSFAEIVRRKNTVKGTPFVIGFWVGSNNTPNRLNSIGRQEVPEFKSASNPNEEDLKSNASYQRALESWNKLPECPFCSSKTVLRTYRSKGGMLGHGCLGDSNKCIWNSWHGGALIEPLPLLIVDEDIYDYAPSVVLGTIDKLALIGHRDTTIRRVLGMFGFAHRLNRTNGRLIIAQRSEDLRTSSNSNESIELYPAYAKGYELYNDPFPAMIIQDETHLLEESLGTFSGVFETTLETMLNELASNEKVKGIVAKSPITGDPRNIKIIAASATVSNPERQIRQIFQRETVQFPYPGPTLYTSFYSSPEEPSGKEKNSRSTIEETEIRAHRARIYSTIMTNGKPHTSTTVTLLANFHLLISEHLKKLFSSDTNQQNESRQALIDALPDSLLKRSFVNFIKTAPADELATLIDIHRIALTYVTNKKGGDQIMAAEGDATISLHEEFGHTEMAYLDARLISGAVDASGIQQVINDAETRPDPGEDFQNLFDEGTLRSVVATSAISHGVDMDVLNSMFFAGMPSDVAEYIQASSRVGRTHVGFIVMLPTPQRRRDRYILEIHDIYHRFLERMIRPAAVDRWADKALLRMVSSLLQAYLIGVRETLQFLNLDDDNKHQVKNFGMTSPIRTLLNQNPSKFYREVNNFIASAIGLSNENYRPTGWKLFQSILEERLHDVCNDLLSYQSILTLHEFFDQLDRDKRNTKDKPMTSLRDVDPAGVIYFRQQAGNFRIDDQQAYEVMRILRRGLITNRATN